MGCIEACAREEKTCSNWVQKWHILPPNIRSLQQAAVVDLICFRSTKKFVAKNFLEVKNNFWRQVCCFWARNRPKSWEKWNMRQSGTHWSKTFVQLTFGATAALTAVKLQMFGGKTRHVWQPIRTWFFVSCPRLDVTWVSGLPMILRLRLDATDGITKSVT